MSLPPDPAVARIRPGDHPDVPGQTTEEPASDPSARPVEPPAPATPEPATFTRDELEAAEPERHPSARRRWLLGLGIGALGGLYVVHPLMLICLPFAFTAAGAGALIGTGAVWLAESAFSTFAWSRGDLADTSSLVLGWVAGLGALAAGVLGSVVVARRARAHPG